MPLAYGDVAAVANRIFEEPLQDYINRSNPVLSALQKKAVSSDRIYIKGALSSNHGAGAIADGADVNFTGNEKTTYVAPVLDFATYIGKFAVNKRALEQMRGNPGAIGNLLKEEVFNAAKDVADTIAADVFAGNVANGLVGLQTMINNTGVWAGIDRGATGNENLKSVVVDAKGTTGDPSELNTNFLYQLDEEFFAANGYGFSEMPGLFTGVTDRLIFTKYKRLLEDINLDKLGDAHFVNRANGSGRLGIGSTGFMGVPFIRDRHVTKADDDENNSSRIYFLDMSKIHLAVLTPSAELSLVHQVQGYQTAPDIDGVRFSIEFLANTGESVKGYVKAYVQLVTPNPKAAGCVLKNVKNN